MNEPTGPVAAQPAPRVGLTVAVCAHNAAGRIVDCLNALAREPAEPGFRWEVLLVDNASTDGTAEVVRRWATEHPDRPGGGRWRLADDADPCTGPVVPIRIVRENRPGVMHARAASASAALGDILAWVDDDNLVEPGFVAAAYQFFADRPAAGVCGGRAFAAFEDPSTAPADFDRRFADAVACRDHGPESYRRTPPADDPPFAAGSAVRTRLARAALIDVGCSLVGRQGTALTSGEDTEIFLIIHHLGWEIWHCPGMAFRHVMPPRRLTQEYLDRLIASGARAQAWLDVLRDVPGATPALGRLGFAWRGLAQARVAVRFAVFHRVRTKHRDHSRFAFWRDLYWGRAMGNFTVALHNPGPGFAARLAAARAARAQAVTSPEVAPLPAMTPLTTDAATPATALTPAR